MSLLVLKSLEYTLKVTFMIVRKHSFRQIVVDKCFISKKDGELHRSWDKFDLQGGGRNGLVAKLIVLADRRISFGGFTEKVQEKIDIVLNIKIRAIQ